MHGSWRASPEATSIAPRAKTALRLATLKNNATGRAVKFFTRHVDRIYGKWWRFKSRVFQYSMELKKRRGRKKKKGIVRFFIQRKLRMFRLRSWFPIFHRILFYFLKREQRDDVILIHWYSKIFIRQYTWREMVIIQIVRDRIFNTSTGILFYLFIRENSFGKNFNLTNLWNSR